ncbi:MAG: GNAT family protein [Micrococcus sp.]|nr:GNAT family protein [Micrococcus sp.]
MSAKKRAAHRVSTDHIETTPAGFYDTPRLECGDVCLEPANGNHAEQLRELMHDRDVMVLTGSVNSSARADALSSGAAEKEVAVAQLEEIYDDWSVDEMRAVWVIVYRGELVGEILLLDLDARNRACGLRLWVAGQTGRGIGGTAIRLALAYAFEQVGLHRVFLEVYDHNPRARRLYERLGFVHEGTQRDALLFDDAWVDAHMMSMLASEWAAQHGREV